MRLFQTCAVAALLVTSAGITSAVEKGSALVYADLVTIGQLKLSSYFLSFDGIHANGNIVPTEVLLGTVPLGIALPFHVVYPCSAWDALRFRNGCDYRAVWEGWSFWKERITFKGIWALRRQPDLSWTESPGPIVLFPLSDREFVARRLEDRRQRERAAQKQ